MVKVKINTKKPDQKGKFAKRNNQIEINRPITPLLKKYGFTSKKAIKEHIELEDKIGRTTGCGCSLCMLRNKLALLRVANRHIKKRYRKLNSVMITIENQGKYFDKNRLVGYICLKRKRNKIERILVAPDVLFSDSLSHSEILQRLKRQYFRYKHILEINKEDIKRYKNAIHKLRLLLDI